MLNMSLKIGEAIERMGLKTRKCTLALDCRIRSACKSSKGAFANSSECVDFEGGMTEELEITASTGVRLRQQ